MKNTNEDFFEFSEKLTDEIASETIKLSSIEPFFPQYGEELCQLIDYNTYIKPSNIKKIAQFILKLKKSNVQSIQELVPRKINSGLLLRELYLLGAISEKDIRDKCESDDRLYFYFLPELGLSDDISPKTSSKFKSIISNLESYKQDDWKLYKELLQNGFSTDSVGYLIKNDKLPQLQSMIESGALQANGTVDISPFEINNLPNKYSLTDKKSLIALAARCGSTKVFKYLSTKVQVIPIELLPESAFSKSTDIINELIDMKEDLWEVYLQSSIEFHYSMMYQFFERITAYHPTSEFCLNHFNYSVFRKYVKSEFDKSELPLLHIACMLGQLSIVRYLVEVKLHSITEKEPKEDKTPLHFACQYGFIQIARYLVEKGADKNAKCRGGYTPLLLAVSFRHINIALYLIMMEAPVSVKTNAGRNVYHCMAKSGSTEFLKHLDGINYSPNECDNKGFTPLHIAISENNFKFCQVFINELKVDVKCVTKQNQNCLHLAVKTGNANMIKYFMAFDYDMNMKDKDGKTVLHYAVKFANNPEIVELLIKKGCNVNETDNDGRTCGYDCSKSSEDVLKVLLDNNLNIELKPKDGNSLLRHFIDLKSHKQVRLVMMKNPDLDIKGTDGISDLDMLKKQFKDRFVSEALKIRDDMISEKLLSQKSMSGPIDIIEMKLPDSSFATPKKPEMQIVKSENYSNISITDIGVKSKRTIMKKIHTMSLADYAPGTTVNYVEEIKKLEVVNISRTPAKIVRGNTEIDVQDAEGKTLLHIAASQGHLVGVNYLIGKKCNVSVTDNQGKTALHYAAMGGYNDICKALMDAGADNKVQDKNGKTPLDYAMERINVGLVKLLNNTAPSAVETSK
ncbi:hypothetical protein TVAG_012580 [Trichomonas vaginalis G3]|uniref:Uncharacterized protein n=1 Tax=Trichomonas vaginalis (strain ATCC PRA-98 / G3) TaxID=412133 RepID=A2E908_TRIV3|nr:spectrin binding [Trichomonas vaginalis G3]EAY10892.1 hypothetical protein TVAG_012580 [Trichomonas vaginalis G3]KAI5482939.1 spectrin binding [Trichomonas vaginalis G3]|eukprot:XP_001323115.1 hypothetical protein [Trichomonas vaginalis G3]